MRNQTIADCGMRIAEAGKGAKARAAGVGPLPELGSLKSEAFFPSSLHPSRFTNPASLFTLLLLLSFPVVSSADYFGLEVIDRSSDFPICQDPSEPEIPFKLDVCDLYIILDNPKDKLISVAFSNVSTTDPAGFYQHTFGSDTSPRCSFLPLFQTLVCDSFVSLGTECDDGDASATDPDFDGTAFNSSGTASGGWFNSAPLNGQGAPDANGRVMVARFSYKQNKNVSGDVCIFTQLSSSPQDITEFLLVPFDCAVPGGGLPAGSICYVDATKPATNDCTSWSNACPDLQTALARAAAGLCSEIWVAQGTYLPSDCATQPGGCQTSHREDSFDIPSNVSVYGGFPTGGGNGKFDARDPDPATNGTILSGDLEGDDVSTEFPNGPSFAENSYHVVTMSNTQNVVFDGFKVTAGNANVDNPSNGTGAGLLGLAAGGATVENCIFTKNYAMCSGGGAAIGANALADPLTIRSCQFVENEAVKGGGGLSTGGVFELHDCEFRLNNSDGLVGVGGGLKVFAGGGSDVALIADCLFEQNTAFVGGGAWVTAQDGHFVNCSFLGNIAAEEGGGVQTQCAGQEALPLRFTNCLFAEHDLIEAIHSRGSSFIPNILIDDCEGIGQSLGFCPDVPGFQMTNCTFVQNGTAIKPVAPLQLFNSVLWDNGIEIDLENSPSNSCSGSYSDVQGGVAATGCTDVAGNIDVDPAFVDPVMGNYRLGAGSPSIDAADNNAITICGTELSGTDLDGNQRIVDDPATTDTGNGSFPFIDMGAYEFGSQPPPDCNDNGIPDECDIFDCAPGDPDCADCNTNGIPDECDIEECPLLDPDCSDCNKNDIPDECDITSGADDIDGDGVPDECQVGCGSCPTDVNGDDNTGPVDLATLLGAWGTPDGCLDANDDQNIGPLDLATLLGAWGPCP